MLEQAKTTAAYRSLSSIDFVEALPREVVEAATDILGPDQRRVVGGQKQIANHLAASYERVARTDFTTEAWDLTNERDVQDALNWCILGGSCMADFAARPELPRVFGWLVAPLRESMQLTMDRQKGRDSAKVPTSASVPIERVAELIEPGPAVTVEALEHYAKLGPIGLRARASEAADARLVHKGEIQFIIAGKDSPFMDFVERFLEATDYNVMGITSANFSSWGPYRERSGGCHKSLGEIQRAMGFLGVPILTAPIELPGGPPGPSTPERYAKLHDRFNGMSDEEREAFVGLLPASVSLVRPDPTVKRWTVVRHGSLHTKTIIEHMEAYGIRTEPDLAGACRLNIGEYP